MTHLGPLYARGLWGAERQAVQQLLLAGEGRIWPRWVKPGFVTRMAGAAAPQAGGLPTKVFWRCIGAELWRRGGLPGTAKRQ